VTIDAKTAARLLLIQRERAKWIRRKSELISWDDDAVLERATRFEFVDTDDAGPNFLSARLFPLMEVSRTVAANAFVHLGTEEGPVLPRLSRVEERSIVFRGYTELLIAAIAESGALLPPEFREHAEQRFQAFVGPWESSSTLPMYDAQWESSLDKQLWLQHVAMCAEHLPFRTIYALIPTHQMPPQGTILQVTVKYSEFFNLQSYGPLDRFVLRHTKKHKPPPLPEDVDEDPFAAFWLASVGTPSLVVTDSVGQLSKGTNQFVEGFEQAKRAYVEAVRFKWWIPDTYGLALPLSGHLEAGSYHANLRCPPGVYVHKAFLRAMSVEGRLAMSLTGYAPARREMIVVTEDDLHEDRGHLYFSRDLSRSRASADEFVEQASLYVVLRPTYHNGLRAGMVISVLVTLTLVFFLFRDITTGKSVPSGYIGVNDSTVSLLLVVLSVFVAVVLRQEEHFLTKAVFSHYRTRLAITGVTLFVVAVSVAAGIDGWPQVGVLAAAAAVSLASTLSTIWSAFYSRKHARRLVG